ncbi:unnamed protein product [Albugo candida]|uniref:Uncharacterized protein n=1 Tax=Albugo candida TaxID=65357 RepID=A0A024GN02_9STRA|nr:unnamed protein product [Albugo candida]|eukprot:CCI48266.1 unnamed protein product [Albugo candida]
MGTRQLFWSFLSPMRLVAWIWFGRYFAVCLIYHTYKIDIGYPSSSLVSCYEKIIELGVKRLNPSIVRGKNAIIIIVTDGILLEATLQEALGNACELNSFEVQNAIQSDFLPREVGTSDESSLLPDDVILVTFSPTEHIGATCKECYSREGLRLFDSTLVTIASTVLSPIKDSREYYNLKELSETKDKCSHCISWKVRPARIFPNLLDLSNNDITYETFYSVETSKIGIIEHNGKKNCVQCLFSYCEIFYAEPAYNKIWTTNVSPNSFRCSFLCDKDLVINDVQAAYLPPRPMKFSEYDFRFILIEKSSKKARVKLI